MGKAVLPCKTHIRLALLPTCCHAWRNYIGECASIEGCRRIKGTFPVSEVWIGSLVEQTIGFSIFRIDNESVKPPNRLGDTRIVADVLVIPDQIVYD